VLVRWTKEAEKTHPSQINASGGWWESYRRCGIGNGNWLVQTSVFRVVQASTS
jgi:hypothetical protein